MPSTVVGRPRTLDYDPTSMHSSAARIATVCLLLGASPLLVIAGCGSSEVPGAGASAANETQTIAYTVEGMHCEGCVNAITDKVKGLKGISDCRVSLEEHRAVVTMANSALSSSVEDAIKRLGYTVSRPVEGAPANAKP